MMRLHQVVSERKAPEMRPLFAIVAVVVLVIAGCSSTSDPSGDTSTTLADSVPAEIPSDWITYVDEIAGFSLSYPSDWEVFAIDEATTADLFAGIEDAIPGFTAAAVPFQAGFPNPAGFDPNVTITVEALPSDDIGIDLYTEASIQGAEAAFPGYSATKEVKTVVGGQEAVIVFGSYPLSALDPSLDGRWWMVQLLTVDGQAGWGVSCGQGAAAVEPDRDECEAVVRAFELSSA